MKKKILMLFVVLCFLPHVFAQTTSLDSLLELSLEDLMELQVTIASRKTENLHEAPLSTSVITKQEIINSGATSIQEVFRLIPGFIVREQTNGNYDIHILGYDYSLPRSSMPYSSNLSSLVMIDNRVVFRDFQGGTYWESLPIDITDIERIEVVRGPASALYGPNAVNGVINIITKRASKDGFSTDISAQNGNFATLLTNGTVGFHKNKLSVSVSGNFQQRERYQNNYYDIFSEMYVNHPDSIRNIQNGSPNAFRMTGEDRYPNFANAVDKYGANAFLNYKIDDNNFIDVSFGTQVSEVQKIYVDVLHTAFTTEKSETSYANLKANLYGFNLQASFLDGYQNTLGVLGWEYDFRNIDAQLEYDIKITENMHIVPGVSYRDVLFDDAIGVEHSTSGMGLINGSYSLNTTAFTLRNDFTFFEKFRLIASLRADKYNYPEKIYFSYNIATTYKPNYKSLFRITASRANKGANILDSYIDFNFMDFIIYSANKNLNLMTLDLFEFGYRYQISENLHSDFQINFSTAQNYSIATAVDSIVPNENSPYGITQYLSASNVSVKPNQISTSLSINYIHSSKLQIKPFITYQKATLVDYDYFSGDNRKDSLKTINNDWSPNFYGGIYVNYTPLQNLNINLNTYFYSGGTFNYLSKRNYEIDSQTILNLKVSYKVFKYFTLFVNIRNICFANNTTQFAFADKIEPLFLGGLHFNL